LSDILSYIKANQPKMIQNIEKFVRADSPSTSKELVDRCGEVIAKVFEETLQIVPEIIQQDQVGNHLKFTYGEGEDQILIVGHIDTVWNPGDLEYRVEDNRIYGPGIFDMKGGIIQAIWAVKALRDLNVPINKKIVFLCNADEELGSPTSRPYIEDEARKSKYVFVVEPSVSKNGSLKTARKGIGVFHLRVKGAASHAGNHHDQGVSAIAELARQILFLEGLTNYESGTTVNVGVISGGSVVNVVPEEASAQIDIRMSTLSEYKRIEDIILGLQPINPKTTLTVTGGMTRPPMERTADTEYLFNRAQKIARDLGFELREESVGGGSDGNFTAALGIPTLDGLGCVGDGPHAVYEHIVADALPERTALLAELIKQV
jgi:glutamate carboxypeptidase